MDNTGKPALTVLVVDDSPLSGRLGVTVMKKLGHDVEWVDTGMKAHEFLQDRHVDVALLDLRLPDMDGCTLSRLIRSGQPPVRNPDIRLIAVTGNDDPDQESECLNAGMNGFMTKPIDVAVIRKILAKGFTDKDEKDIVSHDTESSVFWDRNSALAQLGNKPDLLEQMDSIYLQTAPQDLADIRKNMVLGDCSEAKRAAHTLKSSARTIGATKVSKLSELVEKLSENPECPDIRTAISALRSALEQSISQLSEYRTQGIELPGD